jgi:DinB superfamily
MRLKDYFLVKFEALHGALRDNTEDLTDDQWHAVPGRHPGANTIAWNMWHFIFSEDTLVHFLLQKTTPLWASGWAQKLGLQPFAYGVEVTTAEAQALRIQDTRLFREYMELVWKAAEDYIREADEDSWDKLIPVRGVQVCASTLLGQMVGSHGYRHSGELDLARTLLGLPWRPGWEWAMGDGR